MGQVPSIVQSQRHGAGRQRLDDDLAGQRLPQT
jgi:hypothetical protein